MTAVGFAAAIAVVAAVVVLSTAGGSSSTVPRRTAAVPRSASHAPTHPVVVRTPKPTVRINPPHPGRARVYLHGPARNSIALTFDDGFCGACVARIIRTLAQTGTPATIFPNGRYGTAWDPLAGVIRRLAASGQLTIGNHTFTHRDALEESPDALRADLLQNENWIEKTFGVSARPFFRPPYGAYNAATVEVAGQLGYTKVIIWSGTLADSSPRTIGYVVGAIRYWARPGAIILMHANYPPTSLALPQILAVLRERHLRPVTLATLLG
jgi:peptidoglycan/xylan/chitin deacetylase (PgdA/CDA1 family)